MFAKKECTNRESNPGQTLGRRLCYHYTIGARSSLLQGDIFRAIKTMICDLPAISSRCVCTYAIGAVVTIHSTIPLAIQSNSET